jgi:glycosyltransferase involved in cell wall biosynthesis
MPLISVLILTYNIEKYISRCLNSVLNQSVSDFEIIIINDGSTDDSIKICKTFANKDARIKIYNFPNQGLVQARNEALKVATGTYLMFLDGDDYWEGENCLLGIVDLIKKRQPDIILFGAKDVKIEDHSTTVSKGNYPIEQLRTSRESAIVSLVDTNHFPAAVWIFLIKREVVEKNNLYFRKGEDIDFTINAFLKSKTFDAVNETFYMYIKNRPGSVTTTAGLKRASELLHCISHWKQELEKTKTPINNSLLSFLNFHYITSFIIYSRIRKQEKKVLYPLLINNIGMLNYAKGRRGVIGKWAIKILGIHVASHVFYSTLVILSKWPHLRRYI